MQKKESKTKKKVVMVIPTLSTGGAEKFVCDLSLGINPDKYEVSIIVLFPSTDNEKERLLKKSNIDIFFLNKKIGFSLKCVFDLKKIINKLSPDVIHSHLDTLLYLFPSYRRKQVKLHTVHSMAFFEATGVNKFIRKIAFSLFGVIPVAIGNSVRDSISEYYSIDTGKIPCIYNGVAFKNDICKENKEKDDISFINVGTLYSVKNHKLLLEAFKICTLKTKKRLNLTIVGEGELKNDLIEQSRSLGLNDLVKFVGWSDDVYSELKKSDVYVCSSEVEGVSLSIIEAMFSGLPIIATNVGGNVDLIKNNINGMLFENHNVDELVKCMMKMIEDESFRYECGRVALELSAKYKITTCARNYEKLYG